MRWLLLSMFLAGSSCGAAPPPAQDLRDWTVTGATVIAAAIDLTQAVLRLVEEIREHGSPREATQ